MHSRIPHADALLGSRARRSRPSSRCGGRRAARPRRRGTRGDAADLPAVVGRLACGAPTAGSTSATVAMRSDSFFRRSSAPRTTVRPRAIVAASASNGSSSISDGTISGSTSVATSSAGRTSMSATGSPAAVVRRLKRPMRAPMRSSTVSRPARPGLTPTPRRNRCDSGTSVAATMKNAADEMSPGTSIPSGAAPRRATPRRCAGPWRRARRRPAAGARCGRASAPARSRSSGRSRRRARRAGCTT